jgi:hypothetical protein
MKTKQTSRKNQISILRYTVFFIFISLYAISQKSFSLPEGYTTYKDFNDNEQRCDKDFDNDGISDLAIVCESKEDMIVIVFLTSRYLTDGVYHWFPWQSINSEFTYINNVLKLSSHDGKFGTTLKLKYYSELKNMRLIGYESYFGGAGAADGSAYEKSINLLTNEYTVNNIKKKTNFDLITLSNIEKYLDYLSSVGSNLIGN